MTTPPREAAVTDPPGVGWVLFAGIITAIVGTLNVIYGIAAIDKANFFVADRQFIVSNLETWGWVTLILGAVQLIAAVSMWRGGQFGRWLGIFGASFSMIAALLSIPAYPFWSLAVFSIDILIIYGLATYGGYASRDA
jgi:uncharacterized membrane protein (DUF2068 family)